MDTHRYKKYPEPFLLVSTAERESLQEAARNLGFDVLREDTQESAFRKLGKRYFLGVLFDADHAPVELLEFAFNLSDAAPKTPVLVFGDSAPREAARTGKVLPELFLSVTPQPQQTLLIWRAALNASLSGGA